MPTPKTLTDALILLDGFVPVGIVARPYADILALSESWVYGWSDKTTYLADVVIFQEGFFRAHDAVFTDILRVSDSLEANPQSLEDELLLDEQWIHQIGPLLSDLVNVIDTYGYTVWRTLSLSDSLTLNDFFTPSLFSTQILIPPPEAPSAPTYVTPVLPPSSPTYTIEQRPHFLFDGLLLPAPDWGDTDEDQLQALQRNARKSGDLEQFRDPNWVRTRTFKYTFTLNRAESRALEARLLAHLGRIVSFTDHFGRTFSGVVLNPDLSSSEPGRTLYVVNLEIQCVT